MVNERPWPVTVLFSVHLMVYWDFRKSLWENYRNVNLNSPCLQSSSCGSSFSSVFKWYEELTENFIGNSCAQSWLSDLCDFTEIVKNLPFIFHFKVPIRQILLYCFVTVDYSLVGFFLCSGKESSDILKLALCIYWKR